jgi:hypothetical protein
MSPKIAEFGTAVLRNLKSIIRDQLGLPSWLVLIAVGCAAHIAFNAILRKPIGSSWGLIGPVGVGVALESYEIWDQYRHVGLIAPGNDPLLTILGRHGLDILFMVAGPISIVVIGTIFAKTN